jgi:chromosomal replication initiation ATPase DnaA
MRETGDRMLILTESREPIEAIALPDLRTRLATAPVLEIGAPDACLTRDLVEHLLVQRGLNPAPQLGSYVAARIERSYAAIHAAVEAIDAQVLAHGGTAGIRNARAALIAAGLYDGGTDDSDSTEPA